MSTKDYDKGLEEGRRIGFEQAREWKPIEKIENGRSLEPTTTDILFFWPGSLNKRSNVDVYAIGSIASDGYIEVEGRTAGKLLDDTATPPTHFMLLQPPPKENK